MRTMTKIIKDIIELKKKHNLLEEDATDENQSMWYAFALSNGLVETLYDNNSKLLGFFEYVRLNKIPKSLDDLPNCYSDFVTGNILFVANAISTCHKTMWKLKQIVVEKNKDVLCFVWHRKTDDSIKVFKNMRRNNV